MTKCGPKRLLRIEIRVGWVGNPGTMGAPPVLRLLSEIVWKQNFVIAGPVAVGAVTVNTTPDLALPTSAFGVISAVPRVSPLAATGDYARHVLSLQPFVGSSLLTHSLPKSTIVDLINHA
jgi:hypothetical protein